jgi:peptidyl-prolyl cis-trans isomerase B (cyclophilin B)
LLLNQTLLIYNNKEGDVFMKQFKRWQGLLLILLVLFITGCEFGSVKKKERDMSIHHIKIEVENYGTIEAELDGKTAPITVNNFVEHAKEGLYDGTTFHRIMKGFMIQGGDPTAIGKGDSSKTIKGEFANNGVENSITHVRGTISMARRGNDNNSAYAQFFIVHEDSLFLDGNYAGFGHVTSGMEVVDAIAEIPVEDDNGTTLKENQPVIKKITVID